MRFAHLSDSHLGYKQYGIDEREEDFYEVFEKTIDKIIELDVDFVIHSGDLFDQSRPSTNTLLVFQKELIKLNNAGIPVYIIAGNHDSVLRKGVKPPIALFEELGLKIIKKGQAFIENDVLICGIQYAPKSQKRALMKILDELSELSDQHEKSILVLHQGISKYLPEEAFELELDELPDNFNYYALGHIHDFFEEDYGKGKLVYPGSMELYRLNDNFKTFGKGFCVVDMSSETPAVERITLDLPRKLISKTINYENFDKELAELKNELEKLDSKPMLDLKVVGGDFSSSDIYEIIQSEIGDLVLNLRPIFKPDTILQEELHIEAGKSLDPRAILRSKINKKYCMDEVTDLSVDLLDNLSAKKIDDAQVIADDFYDEFYSAEGNSSEMND